MNNFANKLNNTCNKIKILNTELSTEVVDRMAEDAQLSMELSTEVVERMAEDAQLSMELSTEVVDRMTGDADLSTVLNMVSTMLVNVSTSVSTFHP